MCSLLLHVGAYDVDGYGITFILIYYISKWQYEMDWKKKSKKKSLIRKLNIIHTMM